MLTVGTLERVSGVRHAFFTRVGGVSGGIYASHNCGYGSADDPANVRRNRAAAMARLGLPPEALVTPYQAHGTEVAVVEDASAFDPSAPVDGLVTRRPNVALGILTADCAPVLFVDAVAGVVGASHAGWRGALAGVIEATVAAMCRLGAHNHDIVAAVGPCIGGDSYEVGPEFPGPFLAEDPDSADHFAPGGPDGHFVFDLSGYVAGRLDRLGLRAIDRLACDTAADEARFFSYRRARLRGEPDYGRQLSAIAVGA